MWDIGGHRVRFELWKTQARHLDSIALKRTGSPVKADRESALRLKADSESALKADSESARRRVVRRRVVERLKRDSEVVRTGARGDCGKLDAHDPRLDNGNDNDAARPNATTTTSCEQGARG